MVFNITLVWKFLNEPISRYDLIGMILMISGAVLAEVYSSKTTVNLDYEDLQTLFSRLEALLYISLGFLIYIAMLLVSREVISRGLVNKGAIGKLPLLVFGTFTGY